MNPAMMSYGVRPGRAYSVDTATASAAYQTNRQQLNSNDEFTAHTRPTARFAAIDEHQSEAYSGTLQQERDDSSLQQDLLQRYDCQTDDLSTFSTEPKFATWKERGSRVIIKRTLRSSLQAASEVDREINILSTVTDSTIPLLVESLELKDVIWTVTEYRTLRSVGELVQTNGPMSDEFLKTALNQLFSGIASLFMGGFAHLKLNDQTVCLDENHEIMITEFQYACEYGKEKDDNDLYAATQEKYGSDIYVAPEVFANHTYNARKATIWSCGVLIYLMTTGQTAKLSNLNHPSFGSTNTSTFTSVSSSSPTPAPAPQSSYQRRRSSAASTLTTIHYPGSSRFEIPNYARWIIPKMLVLDPLRRAELIEIASRVPKDFTTKATRPLMEIAWLDYKSHVGPYAGLDLSGLDGGSAWGGGSSASSIYSVASAMSNPFRSLLGRADRRRSVPVGR